MMEEEITVTLTKTVYIDEDTNIGMTADGAVYLFSDESGEVDGKMVRGCVLLDDYIETLDQKVTEYIRHGESVPVADVAVDVPDVQG